MPGSSLSSRPAGAFVVAGCALIALSFWAAMAVRCSPSGGLGSCVPVLLRNGETDDGRLFALLWDASRRSLLEYRELPSWNPYHCGGRPLYADPQAPFPGPLFLLFLFLPTMAGLKLWILAHLVFGALGARLLARDRGANGPEQLLAAALVCACGFLAEHLGGGHLSFTPFLFLPWILWAQRRALGDARWAALVAGLFALTVIEGGPIPLALMLAALGLDILAHLGSAEDRRGMLLSLPLVGLLFPLLAAVRLLPVLDFLRDDQRLMPLDDQMTLAEVLQSLLIGDRARHVAGHTYVWPEYNDYLGLLPVLLLAAGIIVALLRRDQGARARRVDLFVFCGLIWLVLGNVPGASLFGLLHELPIYRSLRVPSRFLYPATVLIALLAVSALVALRERLSAVALRERLSALWARASLVRALPFLELLLVVAVTADLCRVNGPRLQQGRDPQLPSGPAQGDFHQESVDYARLPFHAARRLGTPQCYVSFEPHVPPGLWLGPVPQERIVPSAAGSVSQLRWSPSALELRVALAQPALLVINQAFDRGWHSSEGVLAPREGLLALSLPAGEREIRLRHRPPWLYLGAALSALGALLCAAVVMRFTPARQEALRAGALRLLRGG